MSLQKNIVGAWGADLADDNYACALAALGALVSPGIKPPGGTLSPALQQFFAGERTIVWRDALDIDTTLASWCDTSDWPADELADWWRTHVSQIAHPRLAPPLALRVAWRRRSDITS